MRDRPCRDQRLLEYGILLFVEIHHYSSGVGIDRVATQVHLQFVGCDGFGCPSSEHLAQLAA